MVLNADKYQVMNAISLLGYEVFKNGSFHWNSSKTPDMLINNNGTIHCWTSSPFKNYKNNHGDLIDFIQLINGNMSFKEAKEEAYKLLNVKLPSLDTYKGSYSNYTKKSGFISKKFIKNFEYQKLKNFNRYKELLNEALPSMRFELQQAVAKKYQISYIEQSDRLVMPILDEYGNILTLWKYNKNPKPFIAENGEKIQLGKVLFSKGRQRTIFSLLDLKNYKKDIEIYLLGGEKDVLNMIGNGYQATTLGAENSNIPKEYLELFKNTKIIIAYDYDEAGKSGTKKIFEQLKGISKQVRVWDWEIVAKKHNIKLFKGYDMTDFLTQLHIRKQKL